MSCRPLLALILFVYIASQAACELQMEAQYKRHPIELPTPEVHLDFTQLDDCDQYDILVVGAGVAGAVMADTYARLSKQRVLVIETRPYIGGLCADVLDEATDTYIPRFGPHVLATNDSKVWQYVHRLGSTWIDFEPRMVAMMESSLLPMPPSIATINRAFDLTINSTEAMQQWLAALEATTGSVHELPTLPEGLVEDDSIRSNWDDRLTTHTYQGLPSAGYTNWIKTLLTHENIKVVTSMPYERALSHRAFQGKQFKRTFFTGRMDLFLRSTQKLERLRCHAVRFETIRYETSSAVQPAYMVSYGSLQKDLFRSVEYKYAYAKNPISSVIVFEYRDSNGICLYPSRSPINAELFRRLENLRRRQQVERHVHFLGRQNTVGYLSVGDVITEALDLYSKLESPVSLTAELQQVKHLQSDAMKINFVINVIEPNSEWFVSLCSNPLLSSPNVSVNWTIYVSSPEQLSSVRIAFTRASSRKCPSYRLSRNVKYIVLTEGDNPSRAWLMYMFQSHAHFADANVFLIAGGPRPVNSSRVIHSLVLARELFQLGATRASQAATYTTNIRPVCKLS
jgi:UDP-galactopyranose mutase